jgi:hypothetical protein
MSTIRSLRLPPQYWALATFFITIAGALGYGVWLAVSAANLAQSTQSEEIVRTSTLLIMSAILLLIPRPWARAIVIAFAFALLFELVGVFQFEVLRERS